MFKENSMYKHTNNRDAAIVVMSKEEHNDCYQLEIMWYNLHYKYRIYEFDYITINKCDIGNWKEIK